MATLTRSGEVLGRARIEIMTVMEDHGRYLQVEMKAAIAIC
jgi:hypothetical protein